MGCQCICGKIAKFELKMPDWLSLSNNRWRSYRLFILSTVYSYKLSSSQKCVFTNVHSSLPLYFVFGEMSAFIFNCSPLYYSFKSSGHLETTNNVRRLEVGTT